MMLTGLNVGSALRFGRRWWPFAALCLAGSAELILSEPLPKAALTLSSLSAACGLVCVAAMTIALAGGRPVMSQGNAWKPALAGCFLLCGPAAALFLRPHDLGGSDLLLAGCLVPVIVAVAKATRSSSGGLASGTLSPGLAAAGGLLLVVPQPRVHSVRGCLVLVIFPLLTGAGASLLEETGAAGLQAGYASMAGCVVFGFAALLHPGTGTPFPWLALVVGVLLTGGAISSVARVGAIRYSAYFVVLPVVVLFYGFVIFRPAVTMRASFGLVLLAWSVVALLRGDRNESTRPSFILSK